MRLPEPLKKLSVVALVLSNLLPVYGVLRWEWDVAMLLMLYWSENLIIGAVTLIKMIARSPVGGLLQGAFFTVHYGGFCGVHGLFLLMLVSGVQVDTPGQDAWPLFLVFVQILVVVVEKVVEIAPPTWFLGFAGLCISHAASLIHNWFANAEYRTTDGKQLMTAPYKRVFLLHVAIICGGWGVMMLGSPLPLLCVLVLGKTALDAYAHMKEHGMLAKRAAPTEPGYTAAEAPAGAAGAQLRDPD